MLVLFETSGGYAVFKVRKEKKLRDVENIYQEHVEPEKAHKLLELKLFKKYEDMEEAIEAANQLIEGKLVKGMKKKLKSLLSEVGADELAVADPKLGNSIKKKLEINCITNNTAVSELMRVIRLHFDSFIENLPERDTEAMSLGVAHGLGRYKFKFSPDKIDKMVISAVKALEDLDKELNNYIMRCKEWYGWHFPELVKLINDNLTYIKFVIKVGDRDNTATMDLSDLLSEEDDKKIKAVAEISMGCEMAEDDFRNIRGMCDEVLKLYELRSNLQVYLKNRMTALAPNVVSLVGEMVGARLIAHAGSLVNLAKHPASTVQILGAEKALFRALKSRHDTPKYGLIYHAQMIGQSKPNVRGKISRMLAAKTALACRVDAFGEEEIEIGVTARAKLERQLKLIEEGHSMQISGRGKAKARFEKYENKSKVFQYKDSSDSFLNESTGSVGQKRKFSDSHQESKKPKVEVKEEEEEEESDE
ncbi:nucleolar protein 58 [Parasteatoda tepidariorum]|uniref:nucleolar protein 58 n=1 Tax=Parasteatoda tepidariorum TaxID=114398 RepID=UPI001C71C2C9|nr:nucleolar protein 58 [Parasteatoda tepidariorum]